MIRLLTYLLPLLILTSCQQTSTNNSLDSNTLQKREFIIPDSFNSVEELVHIIYSLDNIDELNFFLKDNDLISSNQFIQNNSFDPNEITISTESINLIGDSVEDTILILNNGTRTILNIYFLQDGLIRKVPGQIYNGYDYRPHEFKISFENIKNDQLSNLIVEEEWAHNAKEFIYGRIYEILPDTLYEVYSFGLKYDDYFINGLIFNEFAKISFSFTQINNHYPKKLEINIVGNYNNADRLKRTVSFKVSDQGLMVKNIIDDKGKVKIE